MAESFSVIIPLYNKQNAIQRAIRSVLAQTYPHFELIVVDDGSTDESFTRASEIQDERLRIVRRANGGVSAARNRGAAEARHAWLAFLDADDEWTPEFLAMMTELRTAFPECGLLGAGFIHYREDGLDDSHQRQSPYPPDWQGVLQNYYADLQHPPFCSSSVAIRKDLLLNAGGFPEYLRKGEDTHLYLKLYLLTQFALCNRVGGIYHAEAENRSDPRPTLLDGDAKKPYSHALILAPMIREKKIPPEKIQAAIEFMALSDLPVSRQLIRQGFKHEARERMWWYRTTRKYRKQWQRLFLKTFLPTEWINLD